jgi:hypothetical protein
MQIAVYVEHVRLEMRTGSKDEADALITALESSATIGCVDPDEGDDAIVMADVENVKSVAEAVAVLSGIASTIGVKPDNVFLHDISGIQVIS